MSHKKPFINWLLEGVLVFISILGAFYVEEYRQNKQDEEVYISTLIKLREEIYSTLAALRGLSDSTYTYANEYQRFFHLEEHKSVFEKLSDDDFSNDLVALESWRQIVREGFKSPTMENIKVLQSFPHLILEDSLQIMIDRFRHNFDSESNEYAIGFNEIYSRSIDDFWKSLEHDIDLECMTCSGNLDFVRENRVYLKNKALEHYRFQFLIIDSEMYKAYDCAIIILEIDKGLKSRGYDISKLNYEIIPESWR